MVGRLTKSKDHPSTLYSSIEVSWDLPKKLQVSPLWVLGPFTAPGFRSTPCPANPYGVCLQISNILGPSIKKSSPGTTHTAHTLSSAPIDAASLVSP